MNLFDQLVSEALNNQPHLSPLRMVVEKELLHHDILRIMNHSRLLNSLTLMGGTCLRTCYGGIRLSEDLDFTGGSEFNRDQLSHFGEVVMKSLYEKYGLKVKVPPPKRDERNVDTWKIKVETRPELKYAPAQKIHIDICSIPSYDKRPMLLLNPYGVDMGTSGLTIQVESREEIYTDKLIAFAMRPNRVKNRDLWDIMWLHQQKLSPKTDLLEQKLIDHRYTRESFLKAFSERKKSLTEEPQMAKDFHKEMERFLPHQEYQKILNQGGLWDFITHLIGELRDVL